MSRIAELEETYQVVIKNYENNTQIKCQTMPGSGHGSRCSDQHILFFDEFGMTYDQLHNQAINPLSRGICYCIQPLPAGQNISQLSLTELQKHYRLVCFNCNYEHWINNLKNNNRSEYDKIVYMDIDRPGTNTCRGMTHRLHCCRNNAVTGRYLCAAHANQKIAGLTA